MSQREKKYVAVKDDLFTKPLYPLEMVYLQGTKCRDCGEVFFGKAVACQLCQSEALETVSLSRAGKLYSYTINWNKPPGDYKGPEPFQPFAVGLVELPEGLRIISVLSDCDFEQLSIGMGLELQVEELYEDEEGNSVVTYKFKPSSQQRGRSE